MRSAQVLSEFSLSDCTVVLSALLVLLFLCRGLYRTYPVFFLYWVLDLVLSALPLLPVDFPTQMSIENGFFMVRWVFYFLLVIELIDRILEDHPGIAKLGRRAVQVMMVLAVGAAIYTLRFDATPHGTVGGRVHIMYQLERVVAACLLVFLLATIAFLWFFPVRLNRNTKAYLFGFTSFFLVKALAPLLINTKGMDFIDQANRIHLGGVLVCQLVWLFAITQRGAEATIAFSRRWTVDEQQKALAALGSLDREISRSSGR